MIPFMESTRIGFTNPNSTMDAAICATCSRECVRAFLAYGTSRSVGQISIRRAIAGVMLGSTTDAVHRLDAPPDPPHYGNCHAAVADCLVSRAVRSGAQP